MDLDNGASFTDIPAPVLARLLKDITGAWHTRGTDKDLVVEVTDQPSALVFGGTAATSPVTVSGSLAAIAQWATGRGTSGVTAHHPANTSRQFPRRQPGSRAGSMRFRAAGT